ncbi:hypothetical protein, partial [Desulfoplanes sp.]
MESRATNGEMHNLEGIAICIDGDETPAPHLRTILSQPEATTRGTSCSGHSLSDVPAKKRSLQTVLRFKLEVLRKIRLLQDTVVGLILGVRFFAET